MINYERIGNHWLFSDGSTLPVVSGSSDLGDIDVDINPSEGEFSDFTRGILEQVEEADRPVLEKYLSTWDKSVQQEFTSRAEKLRPWEELGSYEDVTKALGWIGAMNDDPVKFYNDYKTALKEAGIEVDPTELPIPTGYEDLPPDFLNEFNQTKSQLAEAMEKLNSFTQSQEDKEIEQKVDNLMKDLHNTHGDFDEDWVLLQMSRGHEPEEAVKHFQKNVVEKYSSPRKPPAKIMPGNGAVPNGQVDLSKMTSKEKFDYAVNKLKMANAVERGD